ncbi:MAG: hypothetical protein AAF434_09625 [Pseudomonadota bacterium]
MSRSENTELPFVSTVVLLPLLLIPAVISGFFLVYALVGLVLDGEALDRWVDEAWTVTVPTVLGQTLLCISVFFFARIKKVSWTHALSWTPVLHFVIVSLLASLVMRLVAGS